MAVRSGFVLIPAIMLPALVYLTAYLRVVPLQHVIFVVGTSLYAFIANRLIRPVAVSRGAPRGSPPSLAPMKQSVRLLFPFTVIFSLLLPVFLLVVAGVCVEDGSPTELARIVAPALFLVMAQICLETVGFLFSSSFTLYVRLGVTVAFVAYRIPVLFTWYDDARQWAQSDQAALAPSYAVAMAQAGAVLNIVFWTFAFLCFLLLYCIPAVIREPGQPVASENTPEKSG